MICTDSFASEMTCNVKLNEDGATKFADLAENTVEWSFRCLELFLGRLYF